MARQQFAKLYPARNGIAGSSPALSARFGGVRERLKRTACPVKSGGMPERIKGTVLKTVVPLRGP
ncbi:MAG: hypothetical protein UW11_C0047G0004 [Parcubacteria group bacterium GW2011_GWA2_43_9b]|nr:MAG: hypothetical protein UW11_C0047G0004 [Parcubacteria group bacterium GW2011_GWA2_43_9b]